MHQRQDMRRMEFHVSRKARDRYEFDQSLFSLSGNVIFANLRGSRVFAHQMNERRDPSQPEGAVRAGQINAMGLVDEILHHVVGLYREQRNPQAVRQALEWIEVRLGREAVDATLRRFADEFPPLAVYRGEIDLDAYLRGATGGVANRELLLEELLLLWLANVNPAFAPFRELFDDASLSSSTAYPAVVAALNEFFETQPPFGPDGERLIAMLRRPAREVPRSLSGQLEYMLKRWGYLLGQYLYRLLGSLDLIKEEEKEIFVGPGPARPYDFSALERDLEYERYSTDRDWMPRLVLLAKNSYVWLNQLSRRYQRDITRLDQIPDEELDTLARWGITGLWLIGLWERSPASQRIKQLMGNQDAVASAYSLLDYNIAADLGGEAALEDLCARAWRRGIRMASDMVPNHMGIDSRWVMEHPDWFVQVGYSPFPSYTFGGPDLSWNEHVGIYIEDHYYTRTDAAVVFRHVERGSGRERFIYHGNDGTSMPWNDTAQLNYLMPEVREAVIQTILHVARQFPVIRFDAAMTLAKKHYQRLWFPEPGGGGDIPSRSEHGLTREQFDALMPQEFWREVVDRAAVEAPDTLLLAEAFWMMEPYFVRTLGMHRVYNSAFMNMLRDEMNAQYRQLIKNTLEFDPEILKRYVNFMNNPDERTAVDQFGKGDKYLGVCTVMATLPGLPMFGHGQVEGFAEKYGMEFRRPQWDELVDPDLVARHEREIFPLLHRRYVFADAANFLLYDFFTPEGGVDEDVYAYSNRSGDERGVVIYHNKYAETRGWLRASAAFAVKTGAGSERTLVQRTLGEGLGIGADGGSFWIFRDQAGGLEYIRNSRDLSEQGLYVELQAYQRHVFLDFREVRDDAQQHYARLAANLAGRGVPSINQALRELALEPVRTPFRALVNAALFRRLMAARVTTPVGQVDPTLLDEVEQKTFDLLRAIKRFTGAAADEAALARLARKELAAILELPIIERRLSGEAATIAAGVRHGLGEHVATWSTLFGWLFTHALGKVASADDFAEQSRAWFDEWTLGRIFADALCDLGLDDRAARYWTGWLKALVGHQRWFEPATDERRAAADDRAYQALETWLRDADVERFLQVNRHHDVLWFNHEAFQQCLSWMLALQIIEARAAAEDNGRSRSMDELQASYEVVRALQQAETQSGYQVERLLRAAKHGAPAAGEREEQQT